MTDAESARTVGDVIAAHHPTFAVVVWIGLGAAILAALGVTIGLLSWRRLERNDHARRLEIEDRVDAIVQTSALTPEDRAWLERMGWNDPNTCADRADYRQAAQGGDGMSDCPRCDQWRYDSSAPCVLARPTGDAMPVLWDGERLRRGFPSEVPHPRRAATGAHICFEHPMDPDVLAFGPMGVWRL